MLICSLASCPFSICLVVNQFWSLFKKEDKSIRFWILCLGRASIYFLGRVGLSKSCCLLLPWDGEDVASIGVPSSSNLPYWHEVFAFWRKDFQSHFQSFLSSFSEHYELSYWSWVRKRNGIWAHLISVLEGIRYKKLLLVILWLSSSHDGIRT